MTSRVLLAISLLVAGVNLSAIQRQANASGGVEISGELRQWHKVTLTLDGPQSDETAADPNPFMDYRMTVSFVHESGSPTYAVPGYFAGDGNAANTSATGGNKWRVHFSPDKTGRWNWRLSFVSGKGIAIDSGAGQAVAPYDGRTGSIQVRASNKRAPDFRASGRLRYVGKHYLQFAGTGEYFIKAGPDAPETLLAFQDFDNTTTLKTAIHTYAPHVEDWHTGDPTWKDGKGKGLIGALNYLSSKKMNSFSFIPYNAGGDGDNVWPFVSRNDKAHYDISKLDQWQIVFDHGQQKGLHLHFKLQENENDDDTRGNPAGRGEGVGRAGAPVATRGRQGGRVGSAPQTGPVPESLDGGDLGPQRKLYLREMIARFGYNLALLWNLGEENTQSTSQQRAMAQYLRDTDPYRDRNIVVHTFPNMQEAIYPPLLGSQSALTGASVQTGYNTVHERTRRWVTASAEAGKPWVVTNDEQGPANLGVPPDPGYQGYTGKDAQGNAILTIDAIRKFTLWGNLMAGGAGVEYYTGYQLPDNDLVLENFRSRDKSWDYAAIALTFFRTERIPVTEMKNADELVGNTAYDNSRYCFAKAGELYLVYLPSGGSADLDLKGVPGRFAVSWFNPRSGGALRRGAVSSINGGGTASLGAPPDSVTEDWLAVIRKH
jgi:hypothetical protein